MIGICGHGVCHTSVVAGISTTDIVDVYYAHRVREERQRHDPITTWLGEGEWSHRQESGCEFQGLRRGLGATH